MRPVRVEVLDVLTQNDVEVAWSGDQQVVETFPAQGADEPFRDRVRSRCPDRGADDPDVGAGEHGVECGGELGVPIADEESVATPCVVEIREQVAGLLGQPRRWGGR